MEKLESAHPYAFPDSLFTGSINGSRELIAIDHSLPVLMKAEYSPSR